MANDFDRTSVWIGHAVQFVCGALVGGLSGVGLWWWFFSDATTGWLVIPVAAAIAGVLAARWGDAFWTQGVKWFGWW